VGHWQVPPGPEHVSPEIEQSVLVQHVDDGMHWLLAAQAFWPPGQLHWAPGLAQVSPVILQSFVVQHAPMEMHVSPAKQDCLLGGQLRTQEPFWQTWSAPHAWPHCPQLAGSVCRFAHVEPASAVAGQVTSGGLQFPEQLPFEQRRPAAHTCPQPPQLFGSVSRFAQPPSHVAWMPVQPLSPLPPPSSPPLELPGPSSETPESSPLFSLPAPLAQPTTTRSVATQMISPTYRPHFPMPPAPNVVGRRARYQLPCEPWLPWLP
jgi:hypothetical protein